MYTAIGIAGSSEFLERESPSRYLDELSMLMISMLITLCNLPGSVQKRIAKQFYQIRSNIAYI